MHKIGSKLKIITFFSQLWPC